MALRDSRGYAALAPPPPPLAPLLPASISLLVCCLRAADAIHYVPGTAEDTTALWELGEAPPNYGPFGGGVQLIFVGDFLQLPPVGPDQQIAKCTREISLHLHLLHLLQVGPKADEQGLRDAPSSKQLDEVPYRLRECAGKPAFMSVCWREAKFKVVELRTIHRQRDAPFMRVRLPPPVPSLCHPAAEQQPATAVETPFRIRHLPPAAAAPRIPWLATRGHCMQALNGIRLGTRASADIKWMCERTQRPLPARNGVEPTRLFPTNAKCDDLNASRLAALPAPLSV